MLGTIAVPTLVVAAEKDLFTPMRLARELVQQIPGSELLVIPYGTHAALIEQPDLLSLRVAKFLDERVYGRRRASGAR
ncbi:MAG: alpha/beta hydrolase, partial [Deltaproteobacteria bacterium]|nr:alpha/beta hydrolase [Deltaproteobacteria bacterium]